MSDFLATFEVFRVSELSVGDTERLLAYEAAILERQSRRLVVSFGAVRTAVRIAKKYLHAKPLPGSAVELLKEAVSVADRTRERTIGPDSQVHTRRTQQLAGVGRQAATRNHGNIRSI